MQTRNTVQRQLVLQAVQQLHCHPTADMVYDAIVQQHPSISKATVYRNLGQLAAQGLILHVPVPDGADRFDFRTEPHCHARCLDCGAVFDVFLPNWGNLLDLVDATPEITLERCELFFEGYCTKCRPKP